MNPSKQLLSNLAETSQWVKEVRLKAGAPRQVGHGHRLHLPRETQIKAKIKAASFWQEAKGAVNISPGLISPGINNCRAMSTSTARTQAMPSPPDGDRNVTVAQGPISHRPQHGTPAACSPCGWYKLLKQRNTAGLIFNSATRASLNITGNIFTACFRVTPALESFHKTSHPCSA